MGMKVMGFVLKRPGLYRFAGWAARVGLRLMPRFLIYNPLNVWGKQRDLPTPPRQTFRQQFANRQNVESVERTKVKSED